MNNRYIAHYASEYYDPVKAHEYYEQHKQLKGTGKKQKQSTAQKEVAFYVRNQIKEQRETRIEAEKTKKENDVSAHTQQMRDRANALYNEWLSMSAEEKEKQGYRLKKEINKLRDENTKERKRINQEYSDNVKNIRETLKSTLASELEKIQNGDIQTTASAGTMSAEQLKRISSRSEVMKKEHKNGD